MRRAIIAVRFDVLDNQGKSVAEYAQRPAARDHARKIAALGLDAYLRRIETIDEGGRRSDVITLLREY